MGRQTQQIDRWRASSKAKFAEGNVVGVTLDLGFDADFDLACLDIACFARFASSHFSKLSSKVV